MESARCSWVVWTSAIQCFDQEKMIIKTSSGRVYQLYGEPSTHDDALYVGDNWKNDNDAHDELDVTHQYFIEKS